MADSYSWLQHYASLNRRCRSSQCIQVINDQRCLIPFHRRSRKQHHPTGLAPHAATTRLQSTTTTITNHQRSQASSPISCRKTKRLMKKSVCAKHVETKKCLKANRARLRQRPTPVPQARCNASGSEAPWPLRDRGKSGKAQLLPAGAGSLAGL